MTVCAVTIMDAGNNLALGCVLARAANSVTALARADPGKGAIPFGMETMACKTTVMAVLAADRSPPSNDILYRGKAGANIGSPGRIMTLSTAKLMQGQDAIVTSPGVGEQRICRS
jgi:hypothetical protein